MKKYLPYIFNFAIVFIGIIFPYTFFNEKIIFEDHEIIIFLTTSFILTVIINAAAKVKTIHWVCSSLIFYLTVLFVFLLGDQWGLDSTNIFSSFFIEYISPGPHYDPLPHILEFNYPIGILILSVINLFTQLIALGIADLINKIADRVKKKFKMT